MTPEEYREGTVIENEGWKVEGRPPILSQCFMSEKWCMSEKAITSHWSLRRGNEKNPQAFVIMPFNREMNLVYETQIKPMLANLDNPLVPSRADTVMRTGYIICQKICLPILMADLVVAEISYVHSNVLYELGFCVALNRKVLLMAQQHGDDEKPSCPPGVRELFNRWKFDQNYNPCYLYKPMECMGTCSEWLQSKIWQLPTPTMPGGAPGKIGILGGYNLLLAEDFDPASATEKANGFQLTDALRSQLGNSVRDEICRIKGYDVEADHEKNLRQERVSNTQIEKENERRNFLNSFKSYVDNKSQPVNDEDKQYFAWMHVRSLRIDENGFGEIAGFIESCEYIIIDISHPEDSSHPQDSLSEAINLFWIGYCHGRGKKVIPLEAYVDDKKSGDKKPGGGNPFDIQGLYSFAYDAGHPQKPCEELTVSFEIEKAVKQEVRNAFWKPFFKEPQLKVFVGALFLGSKYALNEWDYLTLAELNGYLSEAKPTLQNEIISPIYQPPQDVIERLLENDTYEEYLEGHLKGRNCILVGSADVNILTELMLAKSFNIEPFNPKLQEAQKFWGCIIHKPSKRARRLTLCENERKWELSSDRPDEDVSHKTSCRKFTFCNLSDSDQAEPTPEISQTRHVVFHHSYGFFLYIKNPYSEESDPENSNWVVILSGISGPATLALAQMLAGNRNDPKPTIPSDLFTTPCAVSYSGDKYTLKLKLKQDSIYEVARESKFKQNLKVLLARYGEVEEVTRTAQNEIDVTFSRIASREQWDRPEEFRITPDYDQMSLELLKKINASIAARKDQEMVGAIIEVLIEETDQGAEPYWRDRRRVIGWRLAEPEEGFQNPFTISPSTTPHPHPFRRSSKATGKQGKAD